MTVKAASSAGTVNPNTLTNPLSQNELVAIEKKITEFVMRDQAIFFGIACSNEFDFLGRWYPCPIEFNRDRYTNATAAIEAQRFSWRSEFRTLNAEEAINLSRAKNDSRNPIQEEVVTEAVFRTKFSQNPGLKKLLLSTGDAYIAYSNYSHDQDWGDGFTCTGKNKYGCILMQVRKQLGGKGEVPKPDNLYQIKKNQLGKEFSN